MKKPIRSPLTWLTILLIGTVVFMQGLAQGGQRMAQTYVLVHGNFVAGWCWDEVKTELEKAGNKVVVVNLSGHGDDKTPYAQMTLENYTSTVTKVLDAQTMPVILVGHSAAGAVISQVAEAKPNKVKELVYLAAYLLKNGQSIFDIAGTDPSGFGANLVIDQTVGTATIKPEAIKPIFLTGVPEPKASQIAPRVQTESLASSVAPVKITEANFGRVPRIYTSTLKDKVVSPEAQKAMYTATPVRSVFTLDTGHSAFSSMPKELGAILLTP